jgi:mercuric ion transport protein
MAINPESQDWQARHGTKLLLVGGIIGALAASSCCILPVVLFSMGISGAWIGNFTRLAPYQPYIVAVTAGLLGTGYWLVYRSAKKACAKAKLAPGHYRTGWSKSC